MKYKLKQRDLLAQKKPIDSISLMWIEYDLQNIDCNENQCNINVNGMNILATIDFALKAKHQRLLNAAFALYRTQMAEINRIDLLKDLYINRFPKQFAKLASENIGLYFRMKALFFELEHQNDSANCYFDKAQRIVASEQNLIFQSKFFFR